VLTATYNQERYIERCLESVRGQTYTNLEHVVVDDGSVDGTRRNLESRRDIVYVPQENAGNVVSRNRALEHSSGELIAVLDGDDWWDLQKLELQVALMDSDPRIGLVYTGIVEVDEDSRPICATRATDISRDPIAAQLVTNATPFSSMLIRRPALKRGQLLDPRFSLVGDHYLTLQLAMEGWAFACTPEPLLFLRRHAASMRYSAAYREEYLCQMLALLDDVADDSRIAPKYSARLRRAYGEAYFTAAWLMIDRGSADERRAARKYLREATKRWPGLMPKVAKQMVKSTGRTLSGRDWTVGER
jgi:glycosyltransferase involved in cell wall biosynthesis